MKPDAPVVDLVLPTIDRTTELDRCLASLASQTFKDFRVILVDQNRDGRLAPIVGRYEGAVRILRVTSLPGASRARNAGLRHVEADFVAFPDDDCWYPPDLLEKVVALLGRRADLDGVGGRTIDAQGRQSFVLWANADKPRPIEHANVWRTAVAVTIFFRRSVIDSLDGFDETLGVGSATPWGSGEETDYVLRALASGAKLEYDPTIVVYHDSPNPPFTRAAAERAYSYGMGNARVLRKHRFRWSFAAYRVMQLITGSAYFLVRGQFGHARFYWAMARGRAVGWLRSRE
jgi:GT2 family glycosyltransferase